MQMFPWNFKVLYTYMAFHVETCATIKISTVAGYHVMLAALFLVLNIFIHYLNLLGNYIKLQSNMNEREMCTVPGAIY